jgi:alpha-N-arabinofuranosidase
VIKNLRFCLPLLAILVLGASCLSKPGPANPPTRAVFDWFEYTGTDAWFDAPADATSFRNPALAGFYPDPSIVRVDDAYYLVNSSFAWFPGVPIFRSTDLVNWTQIGHVLDRPSQLKLDGQGVSRGIFAPTIRYHEGLFYMITTLIDVGGNFYVTATDPAGPWSDPVWLPGIDGIDPSIFFDDDGRAYILNNGPPDYEPLYSGHRAIWIQELDTAAGKMTGPRKVIVDGGVDLSEQPIWIEAPHIVHVGDWYYLIAAEGGTAENHSEVVFRSREIFGPYEPGPRNPILTQRDLDPARVSPVTSAGHADFVQTPGGDWWAVFLACRPYANDFYNTGRETWMLPVSWVDGWPMILEPLAPVPPLVRAADLPRAEPAPIPLSGNFTWRDEFDAPELLPVWASLRAPADEWLTLAANPGAATLTPRQVRLSGTGSPAFLARRQQHANFVATTSLHLPQSQEPSAGLAAFHNETHHFYLGVRKSDAGWTVFLERLAGGQIDIVASDILDPKDTGRVYLRIAGDGGRYSFFYSDDGTSWNALAENEDGTILSTRKAGGFVGTLVGMHTRTERLIE